VVYAYPPASSGLVEIDLAMSQFSTRIYVYENSRENLFACDNDGGPGGRAYITGMTMYAGNTYYIVVEGDWELHGTYVLDILEPTVGRCCTPTGGCHDDVTSRQCSYHLGHGTWSEGLTCAASCPTLPPPPPGPIDSATVPVNNGCLYGITLASVCDGRLFYNNTCSDTLYTTNKDGDRLAAVAVTFNGWGSWFSTGCWDETRGQLWASRDDKQICLLDPVTGILTEQFSTPRGTWDMDLDPSDGTLWLHEPEGNLIYHYSTDGTLLGQIFPLDTNGNVDGTLRGVCSGIENTVYVSHNDGRITRHDKATGAWRGLFASSNVWQSRALACDAFSFAPQTVIWWKFDTTYYAYAVPAGTCICPGCPPADSVTIMLNAARTNVVVNFFAPVAGTYRIDTCATTNTIYPAGFSEAGSIEAVLGRNQWTDPTAPGSFKRYVVVHVCDGTETRP
ncbi:hypothetical protein KKH27_09215, partial [bacterium]|nr:hypothetical protein [bacterium]MBU1984489.1 hypothetical protein [bacterium]